LYRFGVNLYLSRISNQMTDTFDTICALSSAPGRSGIAIVRVSGHKSIETYRRLFITADKSGSIKPRVSALGRIVDHRSGDEIDEAIAIFYPAPKTYTGEDMTEYFLHGSPVLVATLLDCLCSMGLRLAEPGEFSKRAFLNGKIDLTQAEAIGDIIDATTLFQAKIAARQRSGEIKKGILPIKTKLTEIIVQLESAVEFVEEEIPQEARTALRGKIDQVRSELNRRIDTYRKGRIVRDGFNMAVIGRPNVGKSSLFNALLMQDRSIVMDLPGTTRDMVSEFTNIGGIPVRLLDTAGIHPSNDSAEVLGMDRTFQAIGDAETILLVVDTSRPFTAEETELKTRVTQFDCIVVMNKSDLPSRWSDIEKQHFSGKFPFIEVSAKTGAGIGDLRNMIFSRMFGEEGFLKEGMMITNLRQCICLEDAEHALAGADEAIKEGLSEEFVLFHLHKGLERIGAISGETTVDDILSKIFSRFCIGK
jgi:tRNA modification GTPase